jgi:hypothetical protein
MAVDLPQLTQHDMTDECPICHAQQVVRGALIPAAVAWEVSEELPRFSVALHGAAELLGVRLEEGIAREQIEAALATLLDDIERGTHEDKAMGGPPQGRA